MAHYLFRANYTQAGLQGVLKEGAASRRTEIEGLVGRMGGRLEAMYWSFGDEDVIVLAELPSNAVAAAVSTRISAAGGASVSTTVLLTAADVDEARGIGVQYRAPGA